VKHHVLISIVGLERVRGNGHVKGKRFQEQLAAEGGVPFTLQRATQFHSSRPRWSAGCGMATPPLSRRC